MPECSVRPQYPTEHSGKVRNELDTGTRHLGMFGTTSMPVPDASVRVLYRVPGVFTLPKWSGAASIPYQTIRYGSIQTRHHFGKFGTASIPVHDTSVSSVRPRYRCPDTSVCSVRPPKIPRVPVHPTKDTLAIKNLSSHHVSKSGWCKSKPNYFSWMVPCYDSYRKMLLLLRLRFCCVLVFVSLFLSFVFLLNTLVCFFCLGGWRACSWCLPFLFICFVFSCTACRISAGWARPRYVSILPQSLIDSGWHCFSPPLWSSLAIRTILPEYLFSFFLSSSFVFLSFNVSGFLASVCCACRIQYDGMAWHCIVYCITM